MATLEKYLKIDYKLSLLEIHIKSVVIPNIAQQF